MSLKNCDDCQKPISSSAYECPQCGRPYRPRPRTDTLKTAFAVMIGVVAADLILYIFYQLGR